jgi:glycosyltransferase involved in cell wall biosynthesis
MKGLHMHIALFQFTDKPNPVYRTIAGELRARGHCVWWGSLNQQRDVQWHDGEQIVATQKGPDTLPTLLRRIPVLSGGFNRLVFLLFMLRLRDFFRQHQPDIVQINTAALFWLWVLPLGQSEKIRFLLDFRQINQREITSRIRKWQNAWENLLRRLYVTHVYDRSLFLHSAGAKKILGKQWQFRASVVPLGVQQHFLHIAHPDRDPTIDNEPVRFLYIGTIDIVRKLDILLHAAQRVLAETDAFQVILVGFDIQPGYYQKMIRDLRLEKVVRIEPPISNEHIPELVLAHDVAFAYVPDTPVDWNYHPTLKVLEYRALGMPIIASDNTPNRDTIQDGVNGVIVHNTAEDIARGMQRFITDRPFLRHCRAHAQQMRQGILWSDVAAMYEAIYVDLHAHTTVALPRKNQIS